MANINAPTGFTPANPNARINAYTIATGETVAINRGDPVKLTGGGTGALSGIVLADATNTIVGILAGVTYTDSNGQPVWSPNWPASTTATNIVALVYDDPTEEFIVQYNGTLAATEYGLGCDFVAGTATLGTSGAYINTAGGTGFRIRRLYDAPGNALGQYAKMVVAVFLHSYAYPMTSV